MMENKKSVSKTAIVLSPDILNRFDISFGAEIAEFSSEFATAFQARGKDGGTAEYYALIFKNTFAADLDKMSILRSSEDSPLQKLVDFGKVHTSQTGDNLCAIMVKPSGISLETLINQRGALDESFVVSHIFAQIEAAISFLHSKEIMHGCINPSNIYFNSKDGAITIKENISEYPGFSQLTSFETYERMVCHKAGKSYRDFEADYYAIGVTLCCLLNGAYIFTGIPDDIVKRIKFENGSYESMYRIASTKHDIKISHRTENLIRGLIHDRIAERWGEQEIKKWKKREISQSSLSRLHKQSSTAFSFEGVNYYSPKYLSFIVSKNWPLAKKNIKISEMARWLSFTSKFSDIEDKLFSLTHAKQEQVIIPDEKLARILFLMDENGPFRFKDVTFHPDGLGNLLAYLNQSGDKELIDTILTSLDYGLIETWIFNQTNPKIYKASILGWDPKNIKLFARKKELGFDFERILYETARYLPCQSPILSSQYSVGLPTLLTNLDAKRLSYNEENVIDNHICAYVCKYIKIEDSIKIKQLQSFPAIAKANEVKYSAILALAQKEAEINSLPALTQWIREGLNSIMVNLNSKNIKNSLTQQLDEAVPSGDLNKLFSIITDAKLVRSDLYGFQEAKQQYKLLNFEILKLKSQTNIDQLSYRLGLRVSVIFSYLICIISILSLMVINF